MATNKKDVFVPPYVSVGDFEKFISLPRRFDSLSVKDLQTAGFSQSNSYTLFGSLRALKFYDDKGKLLEREDLINLGGKDEKIRRDTFKKILNRTYSELMKDIPLEDATIENVKRNFELRGAANSISIKAARLFLWLANQAGMQTKGKVEPVRSSSNSSRRQKINSEEKSEEVIEPKNQPRDTELSNDQRILNAVIRAIENYEGLPPVELINKAEELSEKIRAYKKSKNRHTDTPEPSAKGV